jgi:hypothetical protein
MLKASAIERFISAQGAADRVADWRSERATVFESALPLLGDVA